MVFNRKPDPKPSELPTQPFGNMARPTPLATPPPAPPTYQRSGESDTEPESVIGNDLTIEGQTITIRCKGSLRVNGNIQADLHSMRLTVGEEAMIHGSIAAQTVDVYGRVSGAILGARVVLHASAQVEGDIHSQILSIEQGAAFDGRSRKVTDPSQIAPQLEPQSTPPARLHA